MSNPVYTNTNRAPGLANGAHDTGLYDPNRHDNHIVAVYETNERATSAREMLVRAGVPAADIQLLDQSQLTGTTPAGDSSDQGGLWGALKSLFLPDEDAYSYAEGVRRGHAVLSVNPSNTPDRHHVIEVLESTDPIDFDGRLEEWRQAGYEHPTTEAQPIAAVDMPVAPPLPQPGTRETANAPGRVRSYLIERPANTASPGTASPGTASTGGQTTTATTGAESSGMNAPRSAL